MGLEEKSLGRKRQTLYFVFSAPSGVGKTVLTKTLCAKASDLKLSVSMTTRQPRLDESHGQEYYFVSHASFQQEIQKGTLIEYAQVLDHFYGTPHLMPAEGTDGVFDVDWQGMLTLKAQYPGQIISFFLLPPSLSELRRRLELRGQDSLESIAHRMAQAKKEISHYGKYDYVLVNENLAETLQCVRDIIKVERSKRIHQPWICNAVATLMEE